ncbi:hypothetical protein IGI04_031408 [Brassica rapa subsp. trilocularis]|uniref:C2H2-type domain-containing protein n=1 Tax=Brassica rapa subsp. trilocularis TaxID=1813537 RepID=A0ABQ7LTH0_BRACM|nr:hypothetical protein IGI04_031408 [Brassica rapa subsp. trilocularis]
MDSVSGYAGPRQPRTGGKIVRPRRNSVLRTPYDRPAPRSRDPPQQNPSWISRLVYKPATAIASGAGKFISSVVFSESSSSSSEGEDSSSDIEGDEDVEKNITEFAEDETMDLVNAQQSTIQRLGSKRVIEQLLMQETFAREEGDRLIDIIKARVVDHPSALASNEGRHSDNGLTSEVNAGEMSSKAVMEAKRWLEEKKSASNSKSKATEDGAGSPVDVARSYMRSRLPLGSPAANPPPPPPDEPRSKRRSHRVGRLDEKQRCCEEERCRFTGTYTELRKHAQSEHPDSRPSKIDPARKLNWENFQQSSEIIDVLSTIHSEVPRGVVLGDYVIEYGDDDTGDEFEDVASNEGSWWTSCTRRTEEEQGAEGVAVLAMITPTLINRLPL